MMILHDMFCLTAFSFQPNTLNSSSTLYITAAFFLDQLIGDPRFFPHPVQLIAWLSARLEVLSRRLLARKGWAGAVTVFMVLSIVGSAVFGLIRLAGAFLWLQAAVEIYLLYSAIAARDLARHSLRVYRALAADDLAWARDEVAMIVGRDTSVLDEAGVIRACVESVAENLVDGVTAPLFWAFIGGPVGVILYKAINTMDSMFGYKNEKYLEFGWAAARLDDLANYLPARLTGGLIIIAAFILRLDTRNAYRIWRRDRREHASPNSAQSEAAVAGALGIKLGGANVYFGKLLEKPTLGEDLQKIDQSHILMSNKLMLLSSLLALFSGVLISTLSQIFPL